MKVQEGIGAKQLVLGSSFRRPFCTCSISWIVLL